MGKPKLVPLVVLIHFVLISAMVVKGLVFGAAFGSLFGPVMLTIVGAAIAAGLASFILACGAEWLYAKRKT